MASSTPPPPPEANVRRILPPLDERLWQSLRSASWRQGSERFLGRHGAHFRGFAAQFDATRPYVPGDDTRFLDQRLLARTDRDYVTLARLEASLQCLFILDATSSMAFGPVGQDKFSRACGIAWLGAALFNSLGDSFGLYVCGSRGGATHRGITRDGITLPYGRGGPQLAAVRRLLESVEADGPATLPRDLRAAAGLLRGKSLGIVLSDFIAPRPALFAALAELTDGGADLVLIQLLDDAERAFPFKDGEIRFRDPETGRTATIETAEIRDAYRDQVAAQHAALDRFARARSLLFFSADARTVDAACLWQRIVHGRNR